MDFCKTDKCCIYLSFGPPLNEGHDKALGAMESLKLSYVQELTRKLGLECVEYKQGRKNEDASLHFHGEGKLIREILDVCYRHLVLLRGMVFFPNAAQIESFGDRRSWHEIKFIQLKTVAEVAAEMQGQTCPVH